MNNIAYLSFIFLIAIASLSGCSQDIAEANKVNIPKIEVIEATEQPVQYWRTYTSRLEAPEVVNLIPRVSGVVDRMYFKEGDTVEEGDLLFSIDDRPFEAAVGNLEAQLLSAKASLEQAKSEHQRATKLATRKAISEEEAQARESTMMQREADLDALKSRLRIAQLELSFTKITAPISGVISRAEITKGNIVNAQQSTLATIVSNDSLYAYFDIDERTWQQFFASERELEQLSVSMQTLADDSFIHQGKIDFVDNQINPRTGTITIRAVFEKNASLKAGAFARIRVATGAPQKRILIPEKSIGTDLEYQFVLVLADRNILQYRPVKLGQKYGKLRAIESGIHDGELISLHGSAKVAPGAHVEPNKVLLNEKTAPLLTMNEVNKAVLEKESKQ